MICTLRPYYTITHRGSDEWITPHRLEHPLHSKVALLLHDQSTRSLTTAVTVRSLRSVAFQTPLNEDVTA